MEVSTDLRDRADIEALVRRFYGRALHDDLLYGPFTELRAQGLDAHLPVMCDFWETVLFRAGRYHGSALNVHRNIHAAHRLTDERFRRWLTLWHSTVDEMYSGPVAERAKLQAGRIAWAMHRRLNGTDSAVLDSFLGRGAA